MSLSSPLNSRLAKAQVVASLSGPISDLGGDYIADTTLRPVPPATTRGWCAFQCITATVFDAATKSNLNGLAGVSIPAGTILYGIFSQIKLTSGSGIAYNSVVPASNPTS